jgi:hypothetical protein
MCLGFFIARIHNHPQKQITPTTCPVGQAAGVACVGMVGDQNFNARPRLAAVMP